MLDDSLSPNLSEAERYFLKAVNLGQCDARAYHDLSDLYLWSSGDLHKPETAREYYEKAASLGDADSQYMAGVMYSDSYNFDLERDPDKAIDYHRKAAEQGHLLSATELAVLYQFGEHRNYAEAFRYARQSANGGHPQGCFHLGNLYLLGRGCDANAELAYRWYRTACEKDFEPARFMMQRVERLMEPEPTV